MWFDHRLTAVHQDQQHRIRYQPPPTTYHVHEPHRAPLLTARAVVVLVGVATTRLEFGGGVEEVVMSEQVMLNLPPSALSSLGR